MQEKTYKAFISYSHKDEKFAKWLHSVLESYRVPQKLPYGNSKPIKIVANDNNTYILKFRKDHLNGKDRSNINEYCDEEIIAIFTSRVQNKIK